MIKNANNALESKISLNNGDVAWSFIHALNERLVNYRVLFFFLL